MHQWICLLEKNMCAFTRAQIREGQNREETSCFKRYWAFNLS